jgi:hypothetical protein
MNKPHGDAQLTVIIFLQRATRSNSSIYLFPPSHMIALPDIISNAQPIAILAPHLYETICWTYIQPQWPSQLQPLRCRKRHHSVPRTRQIADRWSSASPDIDRQDPFAPPVHISGLPEFPVPSAICRIVCEISIQSGQPVSVNVRRSPAHHYGLRNYRLRWPIVDHFEICDDDALWVWNCVLIIRCCFWIITVSYQTVLIYVSSAFQLGQPMDQLSMRSCSYLLLVSSATKLIEVICV